MFSILNSLQRSYVVLLQGNLDDGVSHVVCIWLLHGNLGNGVNQVTRIWFCYTVTLATVRVSHGLFMVLLMVTWRRCESNGHAAYSHHQSHFPSGGSNIAEWSSWFQF